MNSYLGVFLAVYVKGFDGEATRIICRKREIRLDKKAASLTSLNILECVGANSFKRSTVSL